MAIDVELHEYKTHVAGVLGSVEHFSVASRPCRVFSVSATAAERAECEADAQVGADAQRRRQEAIDQDSCPFRIRLDDRAAECVRSDADHGRGTDALRDAHGLLGEREAVGNSADCHQIDCNERQAERTLVVVPRSRSTPRNSS